MSSLKLFGFSNNFLLPSLFSRISNKWWVLYSLAFCKYFSHTWGMPCKSLGWHTYTKTVLSRYLTFTKLRNLSPGYLKFFSKGSAWEVPSPVTWKVTEFNFLSRITMTLHIDNHKHSRAIRQLSVICVFLIERPQDFISWHFPTMNMWKRVWLVRYVNWILPNWIL